jgi:serine/threonine protein kinase
MPSKPVQTLGEYVDVLRRSGLVPREQLEETLADVIRDAGTEGADADYKALSKELLGRKLVTVWQNNHLLEGRHKGFFLAKYKLLSYLGTGGMSTVYLAEHTMMRRRVAIKVLLETQASETALERFRRECRAVAGLDHPNIVRAHDFASDGKFRFLVMEHIDGPDLQTLVDKQGPLAYLEAAAYIRQAADGLSHAHIAGFIHRDIKPANLLRDSKAVVKILDLGVARITSVGEGEVALTVAGGGQEKMLGTVDYVSPEQAIDSHNVDCRTDIYSLGCTLFFLLTGHPPFPEGTQAQRLLFHQVKQPASIYQDRPDAPPALVGICQRMMAKRPEDRFQTADEVSQSLKRWEVAYSRKASGASHVLEASPKKVSPSMVDTKSAANQAETQVVEAKIRVTCPGCGANISAPPAYANRQVNCPKCQAEILVPIPVGLGEAASS